MVTKFFYQKDRCEKVYFLKSLLNNAKEIDLTPYLDDPKFVDFLANQKELEKEGIFNNEVEYYEVVEKNRNKDLFEKMSDFYFSDKNGNNIYFFYDFNDYEEIYVIENLKKTGFFNLMREISTKVYFQPTEERTPCFYENKIMPLLRAYINKAKENGHTIIPVLSELEKKTIELGEWLEGLYHAIQLDDLFFIDQLRETFIHYIHLDESYKILQNKKNKIWKKMFDEGKV